MIKLKKLKSPIYNKPYLNFNLLSLNSIKFLKLIKDFIII